MSVIKFSLPAVAAVFFGTGAFAGEVQVFAVHTKENYCPAGLQPVTMNGVICCGTPTTNISHQAMMAHPQARKARHVATASQSDSCREGEKGCY